MRAIAVVLILAGCALRPSTEEEIAISDDRCPQELFLAGICEQPPLVPGTVSD